MALFKSFRLRYTLNLLFAFLGYVRELTHGVGSVCFMMIPCYTTSPSSFSISSLYLMGTFHLPCCTGRTVGSVLMSYSPDMSPMQSKVLGTMLEDPGTVNGCRSRLHIDGVESQSF